MATIDNIKIRINKEKNTIHIYSPDDERFRNFAVKNRGCHNKRDKCWSWPILNGTEEYLRDTLKEIYGTDGITIFKKEIYNDKIMSRSEILEIE